MEVVFIYPTLLAVRLPVVWTTLTDGKLFIRFNLITKTTFSFICSKIKTLVFMLVIGVTNYFKIFNSVIKSIVVYMVDVFGGFKRSFKVLFHKIPMLKIANIINRNSF